MILEQRKGDGVVRRFPEGMRVLAVDDDPACLKLIDALLRKCRYDVTVTNQAEKALKMLRENKDKFDLVISDVQMPDMDGFKLLELVGLEMDLPVIMLSAYSDTKFVMKGISHGACDYLIKPVRFEELRNIWQHVIRRNNFEYKDQTKSSNLGRVNPESGALINNVDQNDRNGRKRKEQKTDEEEEDDDNSFENENDDSLAQKKPRVVWSVDLHRKFVAAVNQLGIGKAFPKRILDLMNVEGLTRENVASHLQKYRLYLKRLCSVQHANLVADPSFLHMSSLNDFADLHTLSGPGRLYSHGGMLGRFNNNPSSFCLESHGILQDETSSHSISVPEIQALQNRSLRHFDEADDKMNVFTVSNIMPDTGLNVATPTNSLLPQKTGYSNQLPLDDKNWVRSNLLPLGNPFHLDQLPAKTLNPQIIKESSTPSSSFAILPSSMEEREYTACEEGLLGNIVQSVGHSQRQKQQHLKSYSHGSDHIINTLNPIDQISFACDDVKTDIPSTVQLNCAVPLPLQIAQTTEDYFLEKPSTGWFDSQW